MAMRLIHFCLLAVALHGHLANGQGDKLSPGKASATSASASVSSAPQQASVSSGSSLSHLSSLSIPRSLSNLSSLSIPRSLSNLSSLSILSNLSSLSIPRSLSNLSSLSILSNLSSLSIPRSLSHLSSLSIPRSLSNLNSLSIPRSLSNLSSLSILSNLSSLSIPRSLSNLNSLSIPRSLSNLNSLSIHRILSNLSIPRILSNLSIPRILSNLMDEHHKIPCGSSNITSSECDAINCCFDGYSCYYGKYVTLQCTKDGQFIIVIAKDATLPHIDLETVSFLGAGAECHPAGATSAFAIYQFPVTSCGTIMRDEPGVIVYENRMSSFYEVAIGPRGAITRDSHFDLSVQCRYIGTSVEALVVEVGLVPPPSPVAAPGILRVELRLGSGQCLTKGCHEEDVAYTSYYNDADYPVTKVLRDNVYVEVRMLERTDPNLVLTLGRCWATTSSFSNSVPQWDLLIDGCPNHDDHYLTTLVPVDASSGLEFPTHYRRFIFKMFTFVGYGPVGPSDPSKKAPSDAPSVPLKEHVYIHCDVSVCQPSFSNNCEPRCPYRKARDISGSTKKAYREETVVVSSEEIVFTAGSQ
ncbi:hypothetical protein OJAV_G00056940 [Oryzias javanicus]|uniref:Zona pellucida sperm-binding protein 4 n=1 Tax=Oryzias javanicus TaxID=123683 RepID=A0A3S2MBH3_ORYJA|nr:hypothetical protein OJAV_G00056940 [Oryzias javanicus]